MGVKLWLDDVREAPDGWLWVRTAREALAILKTVVVDEISLDHDLGLDGVTAEDENGQSGYDVARYIEEMAYEGRMSRLKWSVHSSNPVGRKRMEAALRSAERFWG